MTEELAQTALDFCREVLGWKDAAGTYDVNTVFEHLRDEPSAAFGFTDLNAVMAAVRGWCDKTGCDIELRYPLTRAAMVFFAKA